MTEALNAGFGLPPELEAALRAKAEKIAEAQIDEDALLAQYVVEAKAKREADLRERAATLSVPAAPSLDAHGFPKKYAQITIYRDPAPRALGYVPVSVNGYVWKIQRGVPVIVPSVVLEVLDNAITEQVVQAEGGLICTPVHRFQYQTLRHDVPEADWIAFREKNKAAVQAAV